MGKVVDYYLWGDGWMDGCMKEWIDREVDEDE
jgi:hypothetical protein